MKSGANHFTYSHRQTIPKNGSIDLDASDFDPVDGLRRIDADVSLIFLSANAIMFTGEVNDPLYSAHQPLPGMKTPGTGNETITLYVRDETATVLGCATQYQACNSKLPQDRGCIPPSGYNDLLYNVRKIAESRKEENIFGYYLGTTLYQFNTPESIAFRLGEWSLTSRYTLNQGIQAKLPDNQWQLDVEHWHDISMASLQSGVVNAATGPSDPSILEVWQSPQNAEEHKVCHNTVRLHKPEPPSSPHTIRKLQPLSQPSILRVRRHTNPICSLRALTVLTDRKPSATHTPTSPSSA